MRVRELLLACCLLGCGSDAEPDPNSSPSDDPTGGASGSAMSGGSGGNANGGSAGNTMATVGGAAGGGGAGAGAGGRAGAGGGAGAGGSASAGDGGALVPLRKPTHVACIGDSITYGAGNISHSYPSNLQTLFGTTVKVQNFGVSGTTIVSTSYGPYVNTQQYKDATAFVANAGASSVVDVVIMLGTNDSAKDNWTPNGKPKNDQRFLTEYGEMVDHFTSLPTHPQVVLVLPPAVGVVPMGVLINGTTLHDEVIPLIKQVAAQKGIPVIDANTPTMNHPEYFMVDNIHPNDVGYVALAQIIYDGLTGTNK